MQEKKKITENCKKKKKAWKSSEKQKFMVPWKNLMLTKLKFKIHF